MPLSRALRTDGCYLLGKLHRCKLSGPKWFLHGQQRCRQFLGFWIGGFEEAQDCPLCKFVILDSKNRIGLLYCY